jgi:hypothetical protein
LSQETRAKAGSLNLLDLALALVVLSEGYNYLQSTYRPNSFQSLGEILFLFLFYWLLRLNFTREYQRTSLFIFLSIVGVFLAVTAFSSLTALYERLGALGFDDVVHGLFITASISPHTDRQIS